MSKIFVQPPDRMHLDEFLEYARKHEYNVEIASFAYSSTLDGDWKTTLEDHKQKLRVFEGTVSLHGPFQDLLVHSTDDRIMRVAIDRIYQTLDIAKDLNVKYVVFHGNFNPLIRHERYEQNWIERNFRFWSETLDRYGMVILLENVWEPEPEAFRRLLDEVKSPRLKICFDTGHANIFSKVSFDEWFAALENDIPYMHINDNKGDSDNELVPGDGTVNWQKFSRLIEEHHINPEIVFEVCTLQKTRQSIKYFSKEGIYPFNLHNGDPRFTPP